MDTELISNNPEEDVLIKIGCIQKNNLTTKQIEKRDWLEASFYRWFLCLVRSKYGVDQKQIYKFSDDEIEVLGKFLYREANGSAAIEVTLYFIGGWIFQSFPLAYSYRSRYRQMEKVFGNNFFSAKRLRELHKT